MAALTSRANGGGLAGAALLVGLLAVSAQPASAQARIIPPPDACAGGRPGDWTIVMLLSVKASQDGAYARLYALFGATIPDSVNVVVDVIGKSRQRYLVAGGTTGHPVECPSPGASGGLEQDLRDVLRWSRRLYPARHQAVYFFAHGVPFTFTSAQWSLSVPKERARALPAHAWSTATALEVQRGLDGSTVDVLLFDACLMASIETAFQLRESAAFMVASEELAEAPTPWPFGRWLRALGEPRERPTALPRWTADAAVRAFADQTGPISSETLSAIDLEQVSAAIDELDKLTRRLVPALGSVQTAIEATFPKVESYGGGKYRSQIDLVRWLLVVAATPAFADYHLDALSVAERLATAVSEAYAGNSRHGLWGSHGLSIFFPKDVDAYCDNVSIYGSNNLEFSTRHWRTFLNALYPGRCRSAQVTVRPL